MFDYFGVRIDDWLIDWAWVWHGIDIVHHSNAEGKVMVIVYDGDLQCKIP